MEKEKLLLWVPIMSVFISGVFALLTTWVTWTLANRREKKRLSLELNRKEWQELELLYANSIALIDKIVQTTKADDDYLQVIDQMTVVSAQISIRGSETVNKQYQVVGNTLSVWTSAYQRSKPHKIGDSNQGIITTENIKYRDMADEIFKKELLKDIQEYIQIVKAELKNSKPSYQ